MPFFQQRWRRDTAVCFAVVYESQSTVIGCKSVFTITDNTFRRIYGKFIAFESYIISSASNFLCRLFQKYTVYVHSTSKLRLILREENVGGVVRRKGGGEKKRNRIHKRTGAKIGNPRSARCCWTGDCVAWSDLAQGKPILAKIRLLWWMKTAGTVKIYAQNYLQARLSEVNRQ